MKKRIPSILFGLVLFAYTLWAALDTFVIVRVLTPDSVQTASTAVSVTQTAQESTAVPVTYLIAEGEAVSDAEEVTATADAIATADTTATADSTVISTDTEYHDGSIDVTITEMRVNDTTVYVADVQIADISLLKTAFAGSTYARNLTETTSSQASTVGAILAINGDYYGAQESGYVLRNGVLYRSSAKRNTDALVIGMDGHFSIVNESSTSAETLQAANAWQVLTFGPALVEDGEVTVSARDEVSRSMQSNPRTAIGEIDAGHYLLVVADGRTSQSEGLSLQELAEVMQSLGAKVAYNLDGGGSSTMVFQGRVVNQPTTNGRSIQERSVSDIVYIGY